MLPGIPVLGINQLNQLVSNRFASYLGEGGVNFPYYAYRVTELAFGAVVVQLTTVLLPLLSRELKDNPERAPRTLLNTITLVSFVTLPTATVLAVVSRPIIGLLFGGGEFRPADVTITGATLTAYAFSLVGVAHAKVLASAFFAQKDTRAPMWGSLVSLTVFAIGCWLIVDSLGAPGLGWANTVAMAGYASFLTGLYSRKYGFGTVKLAPVLVAVGRQFFASAAVGIGLTQTLPWLTGIDYTSAGAAVKLAVVLIPAGIVYLALVSVLGGREFLEVREALKGRRGQ
jgi:putative peptidoglycan lipid II flippase